MKNCSIQDDQQLLAAPHFQHRIEQGFSFCVDEQSTLEDAHETFAPLLYYCRSTLQRRGEEFHNITAQSIQFWTNV
jgi:hypothetical protein